MPNARVPVYDPRIKVLLRKNVARTFLAGSDGLGGTVPAGSRFSGAEREIDLTPFLGEAGGVRTSKSVRQPAGGFTITLADRMYIGDSRQMESLYGLIEPMDVVEIRMAHAPSGEAAADYQRLPHGLPIVMRGFVSQVSRTEVIGPDGKPQRAVQVIGQDYGKLWQIIQIKYLANFVVGQQLLTFLKFAQNYGTEAVDYTPNQFVYECMRQVFNSFTRGMRLAGGANDEEDPASPVLDVAYFDLTVPDGKVSPFGVNAFQGGTLYSLLTQYGDVGPWNELFLEDREDGVAVVYRPNPFKSPAGEMIQPPGPAFEPSQGGIADAVGVREIAIHAADVVADNTGRSDANVANYYWVDSPSFVLSSSNVQQLLGANDPVTTYYLQDYRNSAPWLYGLRLMQLQTNQGGRFDGQDAAAVQTGRGDMADWLATRRQVLIEQNRDNVLFETGSLTLRGNERIRAGSYLSLTRGGMTSEYYVTQVDHTFVPFQSFTSTVLVERGTGFIVRAQRGRGRESPYLAELSGGGVYGG